MFLPSNIPPVVLTASIGIPDTMLLMLLALMVFGPRRLPEIGRQIGKLMYEFRKISNDFKFQMEEELRLSEEVERQRQLSAATAAPQIPHTPPSEPDFPAISSTTDHSLVDGSSASVPAPASRISASGDETIPEPSSSVSSADFPSIQPPTQGGVVPRAFRGLTPTPPSAAEPPAADAQSTVLITTPEPVVGQQQNSREQHG